MRSKALRLAMLSAGFGLALPSMGAETGPSLSSLEDVVVTATKREEKAQRRRDEYHRRRHPVMTCRVAWTTVWRISPPGFRACSPDPQ
jgi:hypothetical protein